MTVRCVTDLEVLGRVKLPGQSKVDDFNLVTVWCDTENVLRFEVEMKDVFVVHVADCVTDLTHEMDTLTFRQHVIIACDSLQQLMT